MPPYELSYPVNALVSFYYFRQADVAEFAARGLRLIGDSGAFSARTVGASIDIGEFAEWCHRWRDSLVWIASLDDRVNEPEHCWANYRRLREHYGIDVVPTIHAGDDAHHWIDRYADDGVDFLGLGGLVSHRGRPKATIPWLADLMRYARDHHPGMRFHGWGVTNPTLLMALPYYSTDSSTVGSAYRHRRLPLFDPRTGRWAQLQVNRHAREHHDLLTRVYGMRTEDCTSSSRLNYTMWIKAGALSFQLVQEWVRRRHGAIPAPHYGVRDRLPGMHLHAVDAAPNMLERLLLPKVAA